MLKFIISLLLLAMLISLAGALVALFKGQRDDADKTYRWLRIRIALAVLIMLLVGYGFYTGELSISAPWLGQY